MIGPILDFSIARRGLVMLAAVAVAALGMWSFTRLPIDAVPDITNVQVIVNVEAPGYTPLEAEQRITVPLETAMAGLPRLSYTRSTVSLRPGASDSRLRRRHGHLFRAATRRRAGARGSRLLTGRT